MQQKIENCIYLDSSKKIQVFSMAALGDEWLRRENQRVKTYFVPSTERSAEQLEHKRKLNRKHCETHRRKKKIQKKSNDTNEENATAITTATPSIVSDEYGVSSSTSTLTVKLPFPQPGRQSRGRKRVSRALAKQYRKNERLEEENASLKRRLNTVRTKLRRVVEKNTSPEAHSPKTPRSKSDKLLRDAGIDPSTVPKVRQRILFAECISDEIKEAASTDKHGVVKRVVSGKVIKKYKLKSVVGKSTSINRKKLTNSKQSLEIRKRSRNRLINQEIANDIRKFLERDDNSRQLPGKADSVKVGKSKVQKRVLNDYMYNLHAKFQAESTYKVSLATFQRRKPYSIAHVNFSARSVCLCQKHQNMALKLRALKNYKVTSITSPDKFMEIFNTEDALCTVLHDIQSPTIKYQEWKRVKMKDGKERMRVVDTEMTKEEFVNMMTKAYNDFAVHIHNVTKQYKAVKDMKEKLPQNHALVQMDFSENYCCQNMEEVQSAYWNATAITLHPVVIYKKSGLTGELEHKSIVFVSEVLQHNASMVLAIVDDVITAAKEYVPDLKGIHFWTDSPCSQYRNKTVFDHISRLESTTGIASSWHFFEAGHGKGPCDGIGGTTKRNADNAIKQGNIIQDADDFFKWASNSSGSTIKYSKITQEQFDKSKDRVDSFTSTRVKGTLKIHSVIAVSPGIVRSRHTSCVCDDCFGDNGFKSDTKCLWTVNSLTKNQESEQNVVQNVDQNQTDIMLDTFVVVEYDKKCYIGKVSQIDEDDDEVEINCMEESGKTAFQFKWPRQTDKIWLHKRHVLRVIENPKPTGRSKRMFTVDSETTSFMKSYT